MEDIIHCEFKSFKVFLFIFKWYKLRLNQHEPDKTILEHDNGFTMVNTRLFEPGIEPYVLPSQYKHVFYYEVLGKVGWSFVMRHDPRGRLIKYNLDEANEESSLEEEYDDEEHDQHELGDDDDPTEDVLQEIVESDDVANNADESYTDDDMMIITDDDDDDDMANPYNVDFGSNDTDDDLDGEDNDMDEEDEEK